MIRPLNLTPFRQILGDDIPDLPLNKIGRFRLLQALRRKFGANFKNVGQAKKLLDIFDRQLKISKVGV
jgi:hypothetical protein